MDGQDEMGQKKIYKDVQNSEDVQKNVHTEKKN